MKEKLKMKKLRSQIYESFFNPVLHFLPLLIFMVMEDFFDKRTAWMIALPVSLSLLVYIYIVYKKLFEWFVGSTLIFVSVATIIGLLSIVPTPPEIQHVQSEYVVLILFIVSLIFRKKIEKSIEERSSKRVSMINNMNELFRMIWILGVVLFLYVHIYTILSLFRIENETEMKLLLNNLYVSSLVFILAYELIRVTIVRVRLLREEWWPIVSEKGKVIGHIQQELSLKDDKKFMHPIIRVFIIDNNRIYLQKRRSDSLVYPNMWDIAITNHVRMGETVEQCVMRTANERYGFEDLKTIFLSNYTHESINEYHYAFLFVTCKISTFVPNPKYIEHAKWWTLQQIEDNLDSGIFTENFIIELEILKRSGLLHSGVCECDCRLKEVVADFMRNENS